MDRRTFLKTSLGLILSGVGLSGCRGLREPPFSNESLSFQVPPWSGDSYAPMHAIRDRQVNFTPSPTEKVPLIIVGGGLSGLTAAYKLRHEPFVLLERESTLGGNAKMGEFHGLRYAMGSAYLVDTDEPYGALYEALQLPLTPLREPVDWYFDQDHFTPMTLGGLEKGFRRLQRDLKQFLNKDHFPAIPIETAIEQSLKLDDMTFLTYLKDNHYPSSLIKMIDAYCYSALGGSVSSVSAYAGINFYSEIATPIYAFPGGNATIAQALTKAVNSAGKHRFRTNISVYQVQPKGDRQVWVSYFDNTDGSLHTLEAKAVILAVPYLIAQKILKGLSSKALALMSAMPYGAYRVANFCFDRPVFSAGYDHWVGDNPDFTDFITADYPLTSLKKDIGSTQKQGGPFVLTVYAPYRNPSQGRHELLHGDRHAMARQLANALHQVLPFPPEALKEVRLTRYGHQLLTSHQGLIRRLVNFEKSLGPIRLAHSDGQGMASIESAVTEAFRAESWLKR